MSERNRHCEKHKGVRRGGALSPPRARREARAGTGPRPYSAVRCVIRNDGWGAALTAMLVALVAAGCGAPVKTADTAAPSPLPAAVGEVSLATPKEIRALIDAGKGQVVVMNFWATWCPPCVKEMPEFAKFWHEFDGNGVTFLSFTADFAATKDSVVLPFMKSYEIPFPVRIMAVDNPDDLAQELPVEWDGALPATFIFGPEGALVWQTVGGTITRDLLAEKVAPLISSKN